MNDGTLRFVTMVGSLRRDSYHAAIARSLPQLAPAGVRVDALGSIAGFPLYDADLQAEGLPEAVVAMGEAIAAADGVVIVTPEYNYSIPGGLKNALDWLSRLKPQPLAGKAVAIQTASPGGFGGVRCQYHLRQVMVFLDALVLNKPEVIIPGVGGKVDVEASAVVDDATRSFLTDQLAGLAVLARMSKAGGVVA